MQNKLHPNKYSSDAFVYCIPLIACTDKQVLRWKHGRLPSQPNNKPKIIREVTPPISKDIAMATPRMCYDITMFYVSEGVLEDCVES